MVLPEQMMIIGLLWSSCEPGWVGSCSVSVVAPASLSFLPDSTCALHRELPRKPNGLPVVSAHGKQQRVLAVPAMQELPLRVVSCLQLNAFLESLLTLLSASCQDFPFLLL